MRKIFIILIIVLMLIPGLAIAQSLLKELRAIPEIQCVWTQGPGEGHETLELAIVVPMKYINSPEKEKSWKKIAQEVATEVTGLSGKASFVIIYRDSIAYSNQIGGGAEYPSNLGLR